MRVEVLSAVKTFECDAGVSHTVIIPQIEIEEKYCEIAVKRLSQEMLPFDEPQPVAQQVELFTPQGTRTDAWMKMRGDEDEIIEDAIVAVEPAQ
jgi:hypothetical protein